MRVCVCGSEVSIHTRKLCAAFCKFMAILHLKKKQQQQLTLGPWHATQNEKSKRSFCQAPFTVVIATVVVVDAAVTVSAAALSMCVCVLVCEKFFFFWPLSFGCACCCWRSSCRRRRRCRLCYCRLFTVSQFCHRRRRCQLRVLLSCLLLLCNTNNRTKLTEL